MRTGLLIVAVMLLVISLGVKVYGMAQLANKKLPQEEQLRRYKKTVPITYIMLGPVLLIVLYLVLSK